MTLSCEINSLHIEMFFEIGFGTFSSIIPELGFRSYIKGYIYQKYLKSRYCCTISNYNISMVLKLLTNYK